MFSIVEIAEPNRSTFFENKGHSKAGTLESSLWFVTRKAILDNVYNSWNKQPCIFGSNLESDLKSDLDSLNASSKHTLLFLKMPCQSSSESTPTNVLGSFTPTGSVQISFMLTSVPQFPDLFPLA
ncbi:hypothetical protein HD554DRAFT_2037083 [Boletus coccyginus]|nr:hypothetical protein HD554DRAFT_2037083 [Boletus coccyginus]